MENSGDSPSATYHLAKGVCAPYLAALSTSLLEDKKHLQGRSPAHSDLLHQNRQGKFGVCMYIFFYFVKIYIIERVLKSLALIILFPVYWLRW